MFVGYIINGLNSSIYQFKNVLKKGVFLRENVNLDLIYDGNYFFLSKIPLLQKVFNLEIFPKSGAKISRAAGCYSLVLSKKFDKILLKLSSGKKIILNEFCIATIGQVSNINLRFIKKKKASKNIFLGYKSSVRGVAMNPCDHPHGGGNGKKSKKKTPRTP
jgi:large subunit ribosomal protein L2